MSWFEEMCAEMQARHGERGWKRRLAEMLGVSDSNVQNWIRAGDAPPLVRTAYEAIDENRDLRAELERRSADNWLIENCGDGGGFRVLACDEGAGHFRELATASTLELARAVVHIASGNLQRKIDAVTTVARDLCSFPEELSAIDSLDRCLGTPTHREQEAEIGKFMKFIGE